MADNESSSLSVDGALGVAFVVLKLCHVIAWSWWWVLLPFWAPIVVVLIVVIVAALAGMLG